MVQLLCVCVSGRAVGCPLSEPAQLIGAASQEGAASSVLYFVSIGHWIPEERCWVVPGCVASEARVRLALGRAYVSFLVLGTCPPCA